MKKIKLFTIIIVCILLTSCIPTVNKNINIKDFIVTGSNNLDYHHTNIYYNDVKYVEPIFSSQYYRYITESDVVLYKRINFPMAGTTYVYTKETNNPDYLLISFGANLKTNAKGIFFREDIDLTDESFLYKNLEIRLYDEFIPVEEKLNDFLNSLPYEEIEIVDLYDENDTVLFEMKKYPEISYVMDRFVFYDGDYYEQYDGYYYKISEDFVKLCTANGLLFK